MRENKMANRSQNYSKLNKRRERGREKKSRIQLAAAAEV